MKNKSASRFSAKALSAELKGGYQILKMTVPRKELEVFSDCLLEWGALSVSQRSENYHSLSAQPEEWDLEKPITLSSQSRVPLEILFPEETDIPPLLKKFFENFGWKEPPVYQLEKLPAQDWLKISQESFQPLQISSKLWVVPSWHKPPDPKAQNILLDPGMAFGTGHHSTTRLCLKALTQEIQGGEQVLDFGCGSGILAISAMKLGAASAWAVDTDPEALKICRENAKRNRVQLSLVEPSRLPLASFDILATNILAGPLRRLALPFAHYLKPKGRIFLSGIISSQILKMLSSFESWFDFDEPVVEEEWVLLCGTLRPYPANKREG